MPVADHRKTVYDKKVSRSILRRHHPLSDRLSKQNQQFFSEAVGIPSNICVQCGHALEKWNNLKKCVDEHGRTYRTIKSAGKIYKYYDDEPTLPSDVWMGINHLQQKDPERIGYPAQKSENLLERVVSGWCPDDGVMADFFCGGGTTAAVGRRWIACDQSRVAVAITADRLTRQVEEQTGKLYAVPDFTVEHWGIYEARRPSEAPPEQFRGFVLRAFGATPEDRDDGLHGYKGAIPVWVGEPGQKKAVTSADVQNFANAMRKTQRDAKDAALQTGKLRDGMMLAWAFRPDAVEAAERLRRLEQTDMNFIRLDMIRIDSPRFREQVTARSTDHADYENFLTFVQPPKVEVGYKRIVQRTYRFDASETVVMNAGGKIINVQWDFEYGKQFSSTPGYSFMRGAKKEPALQAQHEFSTTGKKRIACKVQDDMGGEGLWTAEIEVG